MSAGDISIIGRGSAGSRLFRVADDEQVVSVAKIDESDEEVDVEAGDELAPEEGAVVGEDLASGGDE